MPVSRVLPLTFLCAALFAFAQAHAGVRGLAAVVAPSNNATTPEKIELGRLLFGDARLSADGTRSCASCHAPDRYFAEAHPRSLGSDGVALEFNAPSLINSAYAASFGWAAPGLATLEAAIRRPLLASSELGTGDAQLRNLWSDPAVRAAAVNAFPAAVELRLEAVVQSLASYVRSLTDNAGPLADYLFDGVPLPPAATRGLSLFLSSRLDCARCHRGPLLSGPSVTARLAVPAKFYRTGVAQDGRSFRAPSLLFVAHTAPYMHDGSQADLEAVVDFYTAGGGAGSELKSFRLTPAERADLLAFLRLL